MSNNDVSSLGTSSSALTTMQRSFDMGSDTDVLSLLKVAHQNALDTDVQNHIRDLVFSYQLSHTDSVLQRLQAVGLALGITIKNSTTEAVTQSVPTKTDTSTTPTTKTVHLSVGSGRPAPRFVSTAVVMPEVPKMVSIKPISVVSTPAQTVVPKQVEPEVTVPSYNQVQSTVPVAQSPEVVQEPELEVVVVQAQTIQAPEVVTQVPLTQSTSFQTVSPENAITRIGEIKQLVNAKVGNPVNLIDQNNQIGREYMNALLDAMKKSNGGSQSELSEAMDRLEKAFTSVEVLVGGTPVEPALEVVPEIPEVVVPEAPIVEFIAEPTLQSGQVLQESITPVTQVAHAEETVYQPVVGYAAHVEKNEERASQMPVQDTIAQNPVSPSLTEEPVIYADTEVAVPQPPIPEAQPDIPVPSYALHSVAKDKQLEDLLKAKKVDEFKAEETVVSAESQGTDPLQTSEVNAGLAQLLSEWSLFKSSGIFGTGPSGKDHVLYLKLAQVPMAAIVAGRFDAATPKIKQSITDYMNGWRYEEGVMHEQSETFEHYLRRVIAHILTKRKK